MTYDPLSEVIDEPLGITAAVIANLTAFRKQSKLVGLPGINPGAEQKRMSALLDDLTDALLLGLESNPTKLWVLTEFQRALVPVQAEDTEVREHFGMEIERIMDIVGVESSDGLLSFYLGGL